MAIYDTEEEQLEAVKRWWKDNSQAVIIGVIVGLGLIFGTDFWKAHQREKHLQASDVYEQLMAANTEGNTEQMGKLAESIGTQHSGTPYADYAALFHAKAKVESGDLAGAKAILEKVIATGNDTLKNIAKLRLVSLMLANAEYEQGLKLIAETDPASMTGFSSNYEELKGDLYVALKRTDEARTAYENAKREGSQSPLLQFKLDDVAASPVKPPAIADGKASVPTPAN